LTNCPSKKAVVVCTQGSHSICIDCLQSFMEAVNDKITQKTCPVCRGPLCTTLALPSLR
jgi:hypothetical protein